jgi:hypothetical protein
MKIGSEGSEAYFRINSHAPAVRCTTNHEKEFSLKNERYLRIKLMPANDRDKKVEVSLLD